METVSVKFEENLLKTVEQAMKKHNYATKTEFIREAIRDKLNDLEKKGYVLKVLKLYGAGKNKHANITDKDIRNARKSATKEIAKELGIGL